MLLNPQVLGRAENAHRPVLDRILTSTATTKHQWVVLTLTASAGGAANIDELAAQVTGALKTDPAEAHQAIAELIGDGLLAAGTAGVELTTAGRARHAAIRADVDAVIRPAYAGIPAEDLATAARVLTLITTRLDAAT